MKQIPLTKGMFATVDDEDYEWLSAYNWKAMDTGWHNYARTYIKKSGGGYISALMHRMILGLEDRKMVGDHIDGNGLNNTRANLRACTHAENLCNRGRNSNSTSGFKGVTFQKQGGKWAARIRHKGIDRHLGLFISPELAHEAYKLAAANMHGEFARFYKDEQS